MATNFSDLAAYICDCLGGAGEIVCKKMFGDYGVYCDGKIFGLICDDIFYVKITKEGEAVLPGLSCASPYEGAKPHFVVDDYEDRARMAEFISATCRGLPAPKPKKSNRLGKS